MNITALMSHVSRHLHTIVRRYSADGELLEKICGRHMAESALEDGWQDYLEQFPALESCLLQSARAGSPQISADPNGAAYMAASGDGFLFLTGPVLLPGQRLCHPPLPAYPYSPSWLQTLYPCSILEFAAEALLFYNLFHTDCLSPMDIALSHCLTEEDRLAVQENFTQITFENQENTARHNPYGQEVREFSSIRNGDLEQLKRSIDEDYIGSIGTLAKTPLRNLQNLGIVLVTLASRAAIEGGVMPEAAYTLSDSYIQRLEEMRSPEAARQLAIQAEYHYASLVQEAKRVKRRWQAPAQPDPRITQCKDYIFTHLHGKLSTAEIAGALSLNANFLSNLFKKAEGITITEYILQEKIKLAKNMLVYSPCPYSDIAAYLGFSSQSHLGRQFKKATGMTLREYRKAYGKLE